MRKNIDKFKNMGDVISALRREEVLTQEELGKKAGLSRITIVKIENSQRAVSLEEAMSIAKVFSIDVDTMYSYINNEEDSQDEENFAIAFKAKGMDSSNLREIKRIELLMEALFLQEEIRGE